MQRVLLFLAVAMVGCTTVPDINGRLSPLHGLPIDQLIPSIGPWYQKTTTAGGERYTWNINTKGSMSAVSLPSGGQSLMRLPDTACSLVAETDSVGVIRSLRAVGHRESCVPFDRMLRRKPPAAGELTLEVQHS